MTRNKPIVMTGQGGGWHLPGMMQVECHCKCGVVFFAAKTPRMRQYVNDTHKQRAARARAKEARTEATVSITPKGWVYWHLGMQEEAEAYWKKLTPLEQDLIALVINHDIEPSTLRDIASSLFGQSKYR